MLLSWLHHCVSICVTTFRKQSRFQNGRRSGRGTRLRGGDAAWVAASKPEASLISVGSLNAVPKKLMPTMGYPGARSKTRCPENEVVAINQIGSPRRIVGGGHDGIELELANRRVNSVDARIAINGERLVIGKPTEDGLRVIGSRLKCIGKVKDVLIEEGHIGTGAGVIEINRRLECPASYRHAKARPENYANLSGKVVVGRFDFHRLRAGFASNGVFFSIVIAEAAIAVAGVLLFRQGRWKLQKI